MTAGTPAPAASGTDAPQDGPPLPWRLRPGVAVTPLRNGLHLRGRRGSVTLEGSSALPRLWQLLEEPLRTGRLTGPLRQAEPGTALREAVDTVVGRLLEHDLLVAEPAGPAADWLAATAERPPAAAAALAATRVEVVSGAPAAPLGAAAPPPAPGALAGAAGRALRRGGVAVAYTVDPALPDGPVLLRAAAGDGPPRAVAAGVHGGLGFVTAPGSPEQAAADARALSARLAAGAGAPAAGPLPASFVPLLAAAAAQRLLCAAGGLPDPADEGDDHRLLPGLPAVLVADARPPRAEYRSWLGPDRIDPDRRTPLEPADSLAEALERVAALGAEHIGAGPAPTPGALRQLPVPLASCGLPAGAVRTPRSETVVAGAPRLDLARLEAFCGAAEQGLAGADPTVRYAVGANPGHAWGRALRRAAGPGAPGPVSGPLPEAVWRGHPQARHWWTTLTGRLGVRARMEVIRLDRDREAYRAVVLAGTGRPDAGRVPDPAAEPGAGLGWAVEATPGDAAAFAALTATAAVSAARQGATLTDPCAPGGSAAPSAAVGARPAPWEDDRWTTGWLTGVAAREAALRGTLRTLTGLHDLDALPAAPEAREFAALLRAFGFTVLAVGGDRR
ncbi:hypothetical protein [Streptomyces roseolilacinus]|uniref:Uncharacterized protein n=1 Tax=Streptomyces roseolilacinus TaxID=66904 RepID=A0A918EIG1_9ACTN|nr:hypothetical protein [Streptomyces roseolilacinus]GGP96531.1 hypothetical protein GCM10010249_13430 [Streptomyces roseolilacinus]